MMAQWPALALQYSRAVKNTVERAAILCGDGEIKADDLIEGGPITSSESGVDRVLKSLSEDQMNLSAFEWVMLREAIRRTEGNHVRTAKLLGISRMVLGIG
ncbi:MAG: hypothetical protein F4Z86_17420 [Gemmatimonadetes bacterium]|nr:hypothetical protein [Gemmatimonadota bacterium]MYB55815.1 hypothetical protein [Gemmatimonadota bacterium]MYD62245.1 hypothetical protein [Gemmatimonadota bacterium]